MEKEISTVKIHNKICHMYRNSTNTNTNSKSRQLPIFYWGVGGEGGESVMTVVSYLRQHLSNQNPNIDFLLVAYESENWNDDFSPWKAQAVFGKEDFGGNAQKTLEWLTNKCIPSIENKENENKENENKENENTALAHIKDTEEVLRFTVGYSLAGLFSLWAYGESSLFTGAVCCSGSLWYEGWLDYVQENKAKFHRNRTGYIYLSLGDKEEKTKNRLMSTVGGNTRKIYALLCEGHEDINGILEWNAGGHFSEPDIRIAKGIYWILKHFVV